jgi:hypothetical protein
VPAALSAARSRPAGRPSAGGTQTPGVCRVSRGVRISLNGQLPGQSSGSHTFPVVSVNNQDSWNSLGASDLAQHLRVPRCRKPSAFSRRYLRAIGRVAFDNRPPCASSSGGPPSFAIVLAGRPSDFNLRAVFSGGVFLARRPSRSIK